MPQLDELAELLEIAPDVHRRCQVLADLGVRPDSLAARDAARPLGNLVRSGATTAIAIAADHLLAWSALYLGARAFPAFAHMTLMRSTIESTSTVRWLIDPTVAREVRIGRGVGVAVADLEERGKVERAASPEARALVPDDAVDAATRIAEMLETARKAGQAIERRDHTFLVTHFGPGEMAYRVLCAHAHGGQSVTMATSHRTPSLDPDPDDLRRVRVGPNREYSITMTENAIRYAEAAVLELYVYHGHGGQPAPDVVG